MSSVQPHESISMMAESEESNRTKVLISMRQPPQNTARLPKAEQWHHANHSTELSENSYVIRINTYTVLANSSNQARGPGVISNMFTESFKFCLAKANTNLET